MQSRMRVYEGHAIFTKRAFRDMFDASSKFMETSPDNPSMVRAVTRDQILDSSFSLPGNLHFIEGDDAMGAYWRQICKASIAVVRETEVPVRFHNKTRRKCQSCALCPYCCDKSAKRTVPCKLRNVKRSHLLVYYYDELADDFVSKDIGAHPKGAVISVRKRESEEDDAVVVTVPE